jgi:signal transduction histidine kinase
MRLAEYIMRDMELILQRWEASATRIPATKHMSARSLRDHGPEILKAIAADLRRLRAPEEEEPKSMGAGRVATEAVPNAAQIHAVLRAESGFDIADRASEYHAMRAIVLSGWLEACGPGYPYVRDMLRFNESIDQALAESIESFSAHVTRSRNLLLGMLSHDLRSPLLTIQMTASLLRTLCRDGEVGRAVERLVRSGSRMQKLLDDLIDFNRSELGLHIQVTPVEVDLGQVIAEEVQQICAAYPGRAVELDIAGDCRGCWDPHRMDQLLNNLVVNALHYGERDAPIRVALHASESEVRLSVANAGKPIDEETIAHMFEPLQRGKAGTAGNKSGLGLGLYIVSEIAKAHGGGVVVDAAHNETVFTVNLLKSPHAVAA